MVEETYIKFIGDISGVPHKSKKTKTYEKVIVAIIAINRFTIFSDLKRMKKKFPDYWDKKGHQLTTKQLEEIVTYLNEQNMQMITIHFDVKDWKKYRDKYINVGDLEEKIMSILYFYAIKYKARRKYHYDVLLDYDSSFKIKQTAQILKRISKEQHYTFDVNFGFRDLNPELRLPDWIAQARKKISDQKLKKYKNFHILKNRLSYYYLPRVL